MANAGSVTIWEILTSSLSGKSACLDFDPSSASDVHACPLAGTHCLGSSHIGPRGLLVRCLDVEKGEHESL